MQVIPRSRRERTVEPLPVLPRSVDSPHQPLCFQGQPTAQIHLEGTHLASSPQHIQVFTGQPSTITVEFWIKGASLDSVEDPYNPASSEKDVHTQWNFSETRASASALNTSSAGQLKELECGL